MYLEKRYIIMFTVWKESMNPVLFCNSGVVVKKNQKSALKI